MEDLDHTTPLKQTMRLLAVLVFVVSVAAAAFVVATPAADAAWHATEALPARAAAFTP